MKRAIQRVAPRVRYPVAAGVSYALCPLEAGALYVVLLLIAAVTQQPLGGPLAGVFMVIAGGLAGLPVVLFVVLPATMLAEAARARGRKRWVVPIAVAAMMAITGSFAAAGGLLAHMTITDAMVSWAVMAGFALCPVMAAVAIVTLGGVVASKAVSGPTTPNAA